MLQKTSLKGLILIIKSTYVSLSPSCTSCVSTWVTVSSTSHVSTSDSDINAVSMYYCVLLLFPRLLYEICVLSFTILPPSFCFLDPYNFPFVLFFLFNVSKGGSVQNPEMLSDRCNDFHSLEMFTFSTDTRVSTHGHTHTIRT